MRALIATFSACCLLASNAIAQVNPAGRSLTADSSCPKGQDFCLTAIYDGANKAINYTLINTGDPKGWRSVAQGEQMSGANMLVAWVANGQAILSHRSTQGHGMPTTANAKGTISKDATVSRARSDMAVFSWSFPQETAPGNALVHIWATNKQTTPAADENSAITFHSGHGGFALDLTKAYNGEAPAVPAGVSALTAYGGSTTSTTQSTGSGSGQSGGSSAGFSPGPFRDLNMFNNRIWIAHMVFMIIAWLLLVPAAILIARYGRTFFTWLPTHRGLQIGAFLSVTIGFFLAVGGIAKHKGDHFSKKHEKVGLAIYILMFFQLLLGQTGHVIRHKVGSRIPNFIHIGLGLLIYALAIWNIHLGFEIWSWWQVPSSATWVVAAWSILFGVVYCAGFLLIPKERRLAAEMTEKQHIKQSV